MAHVTDLGFTVEDLISAIAKGEVRSQTHPDFPELAIFNYTEEVQFKKKWNKITLACRGLILNTQTGEVIARPWEKFFNFAERDLEIDFNAPVEVTDKMDGSLGILYRQPGITKFDGTVLPGELAIATRGSFASEQAIHATKILRTKYEAECDLFYNENVTFLFEIVYPENRIVVNYGDMDDLVLLGAVSNQYGYYFGPDVAKGMLQWPGPVTESFQFGTFGEAISAPDRAGKEGYVIRSGSKMVKLKQSDYVELHRIVTNLNPRTIWQMLGDGKTVAQIVDGLPDEFHSYVQNTAIELFQQASDIEYRVRSSYLTAKRAAEMRAANTGLDTSCSRGQYAAEFKKYKDVALMFNLLDNRNIRDSIWKSIRPKVDKSLVDNTADDL